MKDQKEWIIQGRPKDLGGFQVYRILPYFQKRSVGPFVFLDHMGPLAIDGRRAMDVRPHPHIGLSTVTYLFSGRGMHRDSLGSQQVIEPGDINWMTAGRGIVHSERTPSEDRNSESGVIFHGVQIWVGLPKEIEDCEPSFSHWSKDVFPEWEASPGMTLRLLLGEWGQQKSPVPLNWRTLFVEAKSKKGLSATLSLVEDEIGFFVVSGKVRIHGHELGPEELLVVDRMTSVEWIALEDCHVLILGGEPFPEPRFMWWNFVSSQAERIDQAAKDWQNQVMGQVPGETEYIPLPERPFDRKA